jgi:hypothetical protein
LSNHHSSPEGLSDTPAHALQRKIMPHISHHNTKLSKERLPP